MTTSDATAGAATHTVFNQPPLPVDQNFYDDDPLLRAAVQREGAGWADDELREFGAQVGTVEMARQGQLANEHGPRLETHDRYGHRLDEVTFHPAWHHLMAVGVAAEIHALPWNRPHPGAHVARAAKHYLFSQVEAGVHCPLAMTFAAVPALRRQPELASIWLPRISSTTYDGRYLPPSEKDGCLMGMAMTEKQGGSDVRANTTRARAVGTPGPGREHRLEGHKWFCSAPMCDAFLTLAQTEVGLSCFLVPRWLDDGERNPFYIQRLKDKLGNRSNASAEIEYRDTRGWMVGDDGRGVATILEMVSHTRLDCMLGSAALMRQSLRSALHHCRYRSAFGRPLIAQPLMQNVLADLSLEWQAAVCLMLRVARAYDDTAVNESDSEQRRRHAFRRIATAIGKYWICKRTPAFVAEALECHGGNGYVEASGLPRLYREAPLLSIWEGSGNVMCLDVLRALGRDDEAWPALRHELQRAHGADRRYDRHLDRLEASLTSGGDQQRQARRLTEQLALALQAALLLQHASPAVADAFCVSRLGGERGEEYGTLPSGVEPGTILDLE